MTLPSEEADEFVNPAVELIKMAHRGVDLCRSGRWERGLEELQYVVNRSSELPGFPALAFSYLGYGLAHFEKQYKLGLELCKRGVALDNFEPAAYLFLARTYMLLGSKRPAIEALDRGLQVGPRNKELVEMRSQFGRRRATLASSLSRNHFMNRAYGELSSRLKSKHK